MDVILPVYNESLVLPTVFQRLREIFRSENLVRYGIQSVRFLFVDDGSSDDTAKQIHAFIGKGAPATLIRLSRNFGHQSAVEAGLRYASADLVSIMDADLQDPPDVVLKMVAKSRHGFDVIYAQRSKRKEHFLKVFCYWLFYRILALLSDTEIAMDSGDFCLMTRRVVEALNSLPEKLRFIRGLRSWVGFNQTNFVYEREARYAGSSKYTFRKLYRLATDGIASTSIRPLKVVQLFAFLFACFLLLFCVVTCVKFISGAGTPLDLWFLMGYSLVALCGFSILFSLYIVCGYIGRMYLELKARPSFIVMETIGGQGHSTERKPRDFALLATENSGNWN